MNRFQKLGVLAAACLFSAAMTACQSRTTPVASTAATMPEAQTKATIATVQTQGKEDLVKILDQIEDNVFPGTAGCSLTAVPYTAKLLDWCKSTGLSENEMRSALSAWQQGKDQQETARKFTLIREDYEALTGSNAQDLMSSAGFETDSYPWPDSCTQIMTTLLTALGAE